MSGRWELVFMVVVVAALIGAAAAAEPVRSRCPGAEVNLNLVDAELPEVIALASKITNHRFILRSGLPATKITIFSPRPVCPDEAYEAILSALAGEGLTVVKRGRSSLVLPLDEAVRSPIPVIVDR